MGNKLQQQKQTQKKTIHNKVQLAEQCQIFAFSLMRLAVPICGARQAPITSSIQFQIRTFLYRPKAFCGRHKCNQPKIDNWQAKNGESNEASLSEVGGAENFYQHN